MPLQQVQGVSVHGRNQDKQVTTTTDGSKERLDVSGVIASSLVPLEYDYISLTPPSQPTTIVFKSGGASGTTVATLTIVYSGTDISTVTRT